MGLRKRHLVGLVWLLIASVASLAGAGAPTGEEAGWFGVLTAAVPEEMPAVEVPEAPVAAAEAPRCPPLPFHSIEGYGGGAITPMAYVVNLEPAGPGWFGMPAVAFSHAQMGTKNLQVLSITETLFERIELGYGFNRLGLGSLPDDIEDLTGVDIDTNDVYLHHFNVRGVLIREGSFGLPLPALTAGAHFKYNDDITDIDHRLGGALRSIGLEKSNGVDWTLTTSKTLPTLAFGRPVILTAGLRNSSAAQLGYLGFGDDCEWTVEGSVCVLPTDWLLIAYEYRQKADQYHQIPRLVGDEDDWHAFDVAWIVNDRLTLVAGWGIFGTLANTEENCAWWVQAKYEF